MQLSDAIATGRVLMTNWWASSYCGCALAAGLKGAGKEPMDAKPFSIQAEESWKAAAFSTWPWLLRSEPYPENYVITSNAAYAGGIYTPNPKAFEIIGDMFYAVYHKQLTLDKLIDYVKSIEPVEEIPVDTALVEEVEYASVT